MLASSWARAGGAVASRRTRSAADARSAARSRVMLTVLARGDGLADVGDGDADAPGGTMSLALSCTRCCWCCASSDLSVRARAVPGSPLMASWYKSIMFSSAVITACSVSTS